MRSAVYTHNSTTKEAIVVLHPAEFVVSVIMKSIFGQLICNLFIKELFSHQKQKISWN